MQLITDTEFMSAASQLITDTELMPGNLSLALVPHEEREESSSMAAYGMKPLLPGLGLRKENLLRSISAARILGAPAPIVQTDKKRYCQCCGKEGYRFQKCSGCRWAYYCSPACQRADWKEKHKRNCNPNLQLPTGTTRVHIGRQLLAEDRVHDVRSLL